jgi:hypothetical protein
MLQPVNSITAASQNIMEPDDMFFFNSTPTPAGATKTFPGKFSKPRKQDNALCGWYESSFDLQEGLEVCEFEDESLYQLWELSVGMDR